MANATPKASRGSAASTKVESTRGSAASTKVKATRGSAKTKRCATWATRGPAAGHPLRRIVARGKCKGPASPLRRPSARPWKHAREGKLRVECGLHGVLRRRKLLLLLLLLLLRELLLLLCQVLLLLLKLPLRLLNLRGRH